MLSLSFVLLLIAASLGVVLAGLHLRTPSTRPAWIYGALHGLVGIVGFAALLVALNGPPRGAAMGVAGFGRFAAALLALALLPALVIIGARVSRRRIPGLVIGLHATIAIGGLVILAAYALVG